MKLQAKAIILLLCFAIFTNGLKTVFCFTYYVIDKEAFIDKYCKNKSNPQMHCDGKCKLMEATYDSAKNQLNNPIAELLKQQSPWLCYGLENYEIHTITHFKKHFFAYVNLYFMNFKITFFHPPLF